MTLLLLAGTGEAKDIARGLADAGVTAIASLAGATRAPKPLALETRIGGFGGADGFRSYLAEAGITAVLDATHPFAHQITDRTAQICAESNLPYIQFLRPTWTPEAGDNWTQIDREEDAAAHFIAGQTVFLGTGRQTLDRFANVADCRIICRQIDPPTGPFPFAGGEFLVGRPPFPVADEVALFKRLGVDWLVVKNAGGERSRTKLVAARDLNIPVLMIRRPPMPDGPKVETVDDALAWAAAL
ncbi:precorrin-6A/cobalt-precorrin-6A reductase [Loktanella ponticola]|uniref:Precorrin-6A/cobalt-precorrin-6A reductase n=1 Tax=Yoonia ponticola TaxID=1524255 RepID=A0A7W9BJD3_9RHOB|nr:cobalt-precorrin-6A reductase [Yoonia ponticola]MBB5721638.1 precorrin-6A/cobalt-precorrin-6A reductase [Yoonia ponticola]